VGLPAVARPDGWDRRLRLLSPPQGQVALGFGDCLLEWVGS
jgi:hypothetical protein